MPGPIAPLLLSDVLLALPQVGFYLLRTVPNSMDVATWDKIVWPDYDPATCLFTLLHDNRPEGVCFEVRAFLDVKEKQATIPFYGVYLFDQGIAIGEALDSGNQPITNFQGLLDFRCSILLQSFIPPP